jgi:hypothetical protein
MLGLPFEIGQSGHECADHAMRVIVIRSQHRHGIGVHLV